MKRIALFLATNIAILVILSIVLQLFGVERILDEQGTGELPIRLEVGTSHELMQRACCGVVASGTATLEATSTSSRREAKRSLRAVAMRRWTSATVPREFPRKHGMRLRQQEFPRKRGLRSRQR